LNLKQQLDRLQREVSDLSKTVYGGSQDIQSEQKKQPETPPNLTALTALDSRIYVLEKEIRKLNEDVEELVFQIDELEILLDELTLSVDTKFINDQETSVLDQTITEIETNKEENNLIDNENSLGNLVIGSENLSDENDGLALKSNDAMNTNTNLSPEDEYQQAFNLLVSQQYDKALIALNKFIDNNNKESNLASNAHYYLGVVYIFKKEYTNAALILASGYQKYPDSEKAPDILYKLSESLIKVKKIPEACSTLKQLSTEYPDYKLLDEFQDRILELGCAIALE